MTHFFYTFDILKNFIREISPRLLDNNFIVK